MSTAAVFITCQTPLKSGLPSGVRPDVAVATFASRAWPAAGIPDSRKTERRAAATGIIRLILIVCTSLAAIIGWLANNANRAGVRGQGRYQTLTNTAPVNA